MCIALQDPSVFGAVEDRLKVVVFNLFLTDCFEAMNSFLSFDHPVAALAYNRRSKQYFDLRKYV